MENNWGKWGDDIRKTVDRSIKSGDFSKLSVDVSRIIETAIDNVHLELEKVNDKMGDKMSDKVEESIEKINVALHTRRSVLYKRTGSVLASGILMIVFGALGIACFTGSFISMLVKTIVRFEMLGIGGIVASGVLGVLLGGSALLLGLGISKTSFVKRFRRYVKCLGKKVTCTIADIAKASGNRPELVKKDLRKMIKKEYFLEGHMDEQEGRLIVSNEYYQEYQKAKEQYLKQEQIRMQEERDQAAKEAAMPEHVRQIISEGEAFIQKIHDSNDAIPGEEISAKIDRMEHIVRKIFQRVQEKPELASDMKKMMSYYLPTTVKLLNVYEELDAQPIQGPNIMQSKQEIEHTMDTLNVAFEKLLDGFYQETAWDVSSDISVLHTMLAQEGLTKSDFENKNES